MFSIIELKKMLLVFILSVVTMFVIFFILNQLLTKKATLYIDNGIDHELFFKISYLKSNENEIEEYTDEELLSVESNKYKTYSIRLGNIKIEYDTVVFKYNISESGTWIFNPYSKNNYGLKTVVYNNPKQITFDPDYFMYYYSGEINKVKADYILEIPPESIKGNKEEKEVTKTVISRK